MTVDNRNQPASVSRMTPVPMTSALRERLLGAIHGARDEAHEFVREEALLRRFAPAPMPSAVHSRLGVRLYLSALEVRRSLHSISGYRRRLAAIAAALALFCTAGGMLLVSDATADTAQGLISRSVLETNGGESVRWGADAVPVQCYEVTYEDTFVMDAEEDTRVMVRVPNRTEVIVPADLL